MNYYKTNTLYPVSRYKKLWTFTENLFGTMQGCGYML